MGLLRRMSTLKIIHARLKGLYCAKNLQKQCVFGDALSFWWPGMQILGLSVPANEENTQLAYIKCQDLEQTKQNLWRNNNNILDA